MCGGTSVLGCALAPLVRATTNDCGAELSNSDIPYLLPHPIHNLRSYILRWCDAENGLVVEKLE